MKLNVSLLRICCLAGFLTFAATTQAETFTFSITGSGGSGLFNVDGGTLTAVADPNRPGVFDVTGISGTGITGLLPCATYDPNNPCASTGNSVFYDNLLYPGGVPPLGIQVLDHSGIGFSLENGLDGVFTAFGTHQYVFETNAQHDHARLIAFSITPEPNSFLLLGTGLLGVASLVRRRIRF